MSSASRAGEVLDLIAARADGGEPGARLALVVEGGGMRGALSGGMTMELARLGIAERFDRAYGSSAGTLNLAWMLSGSAERGIPTYTDPAITRRLIRYGGPLKRHLVVDLEWLIGTVYERLAPGMFERIAANPVELHPLATDAATGDLVDLQPLARDPETLPVALRASATLPILAGAPVSLDGMDLLDAGLSASVPFRRAIADGATHVVVLRSHPDAPSRHPPGRLARLTVGRALSRIGPAVVEAWATRAARETADEEALARHERGEADGPALLAVRPAPDAPIPGRLDRDTGRVAAALEAGREAARTAFGQVA